MSTTSYGVNDALAVKLWSKRLDHEALKYTDIGPLIGDDANSVIHRKTETQKGAGDQITYGIRMQLSGAGFTENQLAEGNGESLTTYSDALVINELGHVVGVKSKNSIDQQRVPFDLREEAKGGLADWYAKRFSVAFFNQVCSYVLQTDVRFTGLQAPTAVATSRITRQSARASDDLLVAGDTMTLDLIDNAKEIAITATPKIRPATFSGGGMGMNGRRDFNKTLTDKYVVYLHPYQVTDLRKNTSTGQWLDLVKSAYMGRGENYPVYTGAIGEYNSCILRQAFDVTTGVSATTTDVATVRRAVLLGGQACMMAFGQDNGPNKYRWNEELFDHKRRLEVSAWTIHGLKKVRYNSVDYGTVVISTYAVAHT
jgi:N4-gp56 family major capsid protein